MAAKGRTFKSCSCRDAATGKKLGQQCPHLRTPDRRWNRHHGTWNYQLELPPTPDGSRRSPLRRGGFATETDAQAELDTARQLLAITDDPAEKIKIADLIVTTVKHTKTLPEPAQVRRKVRTGQDLDTNITVGQWLQIWLAGKKQLAQRTTDAYASHIRLYLTPHLGDIPLDKLRVADVDSMFEAIDELNDTITAARTSCDPALRAAVKGRRIVAAATKQRIRATLRSALTKAVKERRIDLNVATLIELDSGTRPKALVWTKERIAAWRRTLHTHIQAIEARKTQLNALEPGKRHGTRANRLDAYISAPRPSRVMVWTPHQTRTFLTCARGHRLYALYHLIAFRGLRRGESCGLRWPDLDLAGGTAAIRWQITDTGQGKPKSAAGEATLYLDTHTINELTAHKTRQNTERLAAGPAWTDTGFVFTTPTGQPLKPSQVTEQFENLAMCAALPPIRLHDLRHGAASILLAAGHDMKVVQETLRLSSITIAADTYTTLLPQLGKQSAEDAAAIIHNATNTQPTGTRRAE